MARSTRITINGLVNEHQPVQPVPIPPQPCWKFQENGREYYAYRSQLVYNFPADEYERETLDMFHNCIYEYALDGKLFNADLNRCPMGNNGRRRVLDIGCGSSHWCYDMAAQYPGMDIVGIDLYLNRRSSDPNAPNCALYAPIDFNEDYWLPLQENSFDLVRAARLCGSVPDWKKLSESIFRYLKPSGFVEHVEIDWEPKAMQGYDFPQEAKPLYDWWDHMQQASNKAKKPIAYPENLHNILKAVGFIDFKYEEVQIPLKRFEGRGSVNAWQKHLVEFFLMCLIGWRDIGHENPLVGMSMSLLTRHRNYTRDQVGELCMNAYNVLQKGLLEKDTPVYFTLHILTARKPSG